MTIRTRGFSLVELVIVIIILGVLSVIAAPRFINLSGDASAASTQALAGAFQSALNLNRNVWLVRGQPSHITVGNNQIGMSPEFGYPECVGTTGFCAVNMLDDRTAAFECAEIWNAILQDAPIASSSAVACEADENCEFLVTPAFGFDFCDFTDDKGNGDNVIRWNIEATGLRGRVEFNPL